MSRSNRDASVRLSSQTLLSWLYPQLNVFLPMDTVRDSATCMYHATMLSFIVSAKIAIIAPGAEITGGFVRIFVVADVAVFSQIVAVKHTMCNGPSGDVFSIMELYIAYIGRKEQSVLRIDGNGGIFPPQKRFSQLSAVVNPHDGIKNGLIWSEPYANHAFGAPQWFVFAQPNGYRTICRSLNIGISGHICGGSDGGRAN